MKYKYLKGSEKDFEGAPEWALIKTRVGACELWIEGFGFGYKSQLIGYNAVSEAVNIPGVGAVIAERQPITEPSWDGAGLPPVGCECEMQDAVGEFIPVDIIANHDGFAFGWNYDRHAVYFSDKRCEFRPRRSEADKKREEAINKIQSHAHINLTPPISAGQAIALYDAIAAGKIPGVKLED